MSTVGVTVERVGIEFVPHTMRYGTPRRLFTVWFGGSLTILCLSVGTLGVLAGLSLGATIVALLIGNAIGTVFMAAHSAQGPQLGIPQMIQSRAQFGVIGAGLPLIAVVASATLYASADAVLVRGLVQMMLPLQVGPAMVLFGVITVVVAFIGYELIHRIAMALSVLSAILFFSTVVLAYRSLGDGGLHLASSGNFSLGTFVMVITQSTAWSLSSAPYVADYSRYLPADVPASQTFWFSAAGNYFGSLFPQCVGAYLAAVRPDFGGDFGKGIASLFGDYRIIAAFLIILNMLQVNVMNLYSAYMSTTTMVTGFRRMSRVSLSYKLTAMALLMIIATSIAIVSVDQFEALFSNFLIVLLYLLTPWSAINLADYYLVRKGRYNIEHMFQRDGIYGGFQWSTIAVYLVSIAAQVPFMRLSFFDGSIAQQLGADIAWIPGLAVPTLLYVIVARSASTRNDAVC